MKDRAALCSLVGVVLLLTAAMIGVRSLTAAPTLPSSTKTITIVDQSTQSPVSGAWVVCSAVSDGNGDGQLETYSGFSDSAGIVTVPSSLEGGSELISVARSGYGAIDAVDAEFCFVEALKVTQPGIDFICSSVGV